MNKILINKTFFKQIDHNETLKKLKQFQGFLYRPSKKFRSNAYRVVFPSTKMTKPNEQGLDAVRSFLTLAKSLLMVLLFAGSLKVA